MINVELHWTDLMADLYGNRQLTCLRKQGAGVMFWTSIIDSKIIGPLKVDDGKKKCKLLDKTFF